MTSHASGYAWCRHMVPASIDRRIDTACFRDGVDRGDFLFAGLMAAIQASEAGKPLTEKEPDNEPDSN